MWKARFIGGLLFMVAAAVIMIFDDGGIPLPVILGLFVVGIALVASTRRRGKQQV